VGWLTRSRPAPVNLERLRRRAARGDGLSCRSGTSSSGRDLLRESRPRPLRLGVRCGGRSRDSDPAGPRPIGWKPARCGTDVAARAGPASGWRGVEALLVHRPGGRTRGSSGVGNRVAAYDPSAVLLRSERAGLRSSLPRSHPARAARDLASRSRSHRWLARVVIVPAPSESVCPAAESPFSPRLPYLRSRCAPFAC
jgi:hypothetical protein